VAYSTRSECTEGGGSCKTGDVGLVYLRARWYDGYLNRFISPDTIVPDFFRPQSINRYLYALANPIRYTGPSGEVPCCPSQYVPLSAPFRFVISPIARQDLDNVQWFGDTIFTHYYGSWYDYSGGLHAGFDLGAQAPAVVWAGIHGTVVYESDSPDAFGPGLVIIRPRSARYVCEYADRVVLYGHVGGIPIKKGDDVLPTTLIGHTTNHGGSGTRNHVHLEIRDYYDFYGDASYHNFSNNNWFYNPAYHLSRYDMNILIAQADRQFKAGNRSGVWFVAGIDENGRPIGEVDSKGNPLRGDPYMQPFRIPRY